MGWRGTERRGRKMDGRSYGRHTTTLLVDHRDGQQRRECLEGNPFYERGTSPGECAIAGEKRRV